MSIDNRAAIEELLKPTATFKVPVSSIRFRLLLVMLFSAGVVFLFYLPTDGVIAQSVYVDENALLPASTTTTLAGDDYEYIRNFHTQATNAGRSQGLAPWVKQSFRTLGLDTFEWKFLHANQNSSRCSVHTSMVTTAVLRAPKGDGKEALMLVVPYSSLGTPAQIDSKCPTPKQSGEASVSGLAITTAILRHLQRTKWLAKDVVLVAVENHSGRDQAVEAFSAWLRVYQGQAGTSSEEGMLRSGNIIAALAIDIPSTPYTRLGLVAGGSFGLLPNLDVVSVITKVFSAEGVSLAVCETPNTPSVLRVREEWEVGGVDHKGMLRCMSEAIFPSYSAFHRPLLEFNVDAVSVVGLPMERGQKAQDRSAIITRSIEGAIRSFNNLIEKLHHSTFLYLLLSSTVFATMEKYVYAMILTGLPLPLTGMYLLYSTREPQILHSMVVIAVAYIWGLILYVAPQLITSLGLNHPAGVGVFFGSWMVLFALVVLLLTRITAPNSLLELHSKSWLVVDWRTLKALCSLAITLSLFPIGILNFPSALCTLLTVVPLVVVSSPTSLPAVPPFHTFSRLRRKLARVFQLFIWLLWSPVGLLAAWIVIRTYLQTSGAVLVPISLEQWLLGLQTASALPRYPLPFALACGVYFPAFLISAILLLSTSTRLAGPVIDKKDQ